MKNNKQYTNAIDYLNKEVTVIIDRKIGSKHTKHDIIYEVNYGYIPNTLSKDECELDAYVLNINVPLDMFKGKCVAVINRKNDIEDKLIVIPNDGKITKRKIRKQVNFMERYFKSKIIMKR